MTFEEIEKALARVADIQEAQAQNITRMFKLIEEQNKQAQADREEANKRMDESNNRLDRIESLIERYLRGIQNGHNGKE